MSLSFAITFAHVAHRIYEFLASVALPWEATTFRYDTSCMLASLLARPRRPFSWQTMSSKDICWQNILFWNRRNFVDPSSTNKKQAMQFFGLLPRKVLRLTCSALPLFDDCRTKRLKDKYGILRRHCVKETTNTRHTRTTVEPKPHRRLQGKGRPCKANWSQTGRRLQQRLSIVNSVNSVNSLWSTLRSTLQWLSIILILFLPLHFFYSIHGIVENNSRSAVHVGCFEARAVRKEVKKATKINLCLAASLSGYIFLQVTKTC